jgi:UDP-N-acetylmuramoyl-tripeptide--D-alanyl-D-alanine ligase
MNQTILTIVGTAALLSAAVALVMQYSRCLMMLQQNSYRPERYRRYLKQSGESTSMMSLLSMVLFLGSAALVEREVFAAVAYAQIIFFVGVIVTLPRRTYKKPLVWTARVKRIFAVMATLSVFSVAGGMVATSCGWAHACVYGAALLTLFFCLAPQVAQVAVWVLRPVETSINNSYIADASRILASMPSLKVVGITGSYGKTSTKHYLHRILSEAYSVCMTPGSFNTTMGVVRTVREYLKPFDEVFICEMGAKQPGDIREICDLVHPTVGIVTAVGPQHLESFKTIENVQRTKFELVDALPADGLAVVNDDFEYVASRRVDNVECVRYGVTHTQAAAVTATDITYSADGTTFTLHHPGGSLELHTRLVGECNISNLLAAVAVALRLGVPEAKIQYAVEKIEQVEHRLNIKRTPGGLTIIDDAFNSNPTGSAMALDVLASMTSGRRIVITPGMIELGDRQEELNASFGRKINTSADVAIIVGEYNREAILSGLGANPTPAVHTVDSFAQAQALLTRMAQAGDTVLYENDLPDTFK